MSGFYVPSKLMVEWEVKVLEVAAKELAAREETRSVEFVEHPTLGKMFGSRQVIVSRPKWVPNVSADILIREFPGRFKTTKKGKPAPSLHAALKRAGMQGALRRYDYSGRVTYALPLKEAA